MSSTVCVISPDFTDGTARGGVWRYDGEGSSWTNIGSPAGEPAVQLYSGNWGMVARTGFFNPYYFYTGTPGDWENMEGPRGIACPGYDTVFGFPRTDAPDLPLGVYQYDGGTSWSKIGPPGQGCLAGNWGVVGFRSGPGDDFYHWTGTPNVWERIGGPTGSSVMVVGEDTVYRQGDDWALYQYDGAGTSWTRITEPLVVHAIVIGFGIFGLVYTDHNTNSMYRYLGTPGQWEKIGPHRPYFAVTDDTVYAIPVDRSGVYRYDGGTSWTRIRRGPVSDWITATD